MLKKLVFVIFLIAVLAGNARADVFDHPQQIEFIAKQIPAMDSVKCKFRQEKFIPSSNIRLNSSGDFEFKKGVGVTFYTTSPIKSVTSYTTGEYKQINSIISAISNKSYAKLKKDFDFFFDGNSEKWILGLRTKNSSSIKDYLKSLEIEGGSSISKMTITTKDMVKTTIWFAN